MARKITYMQAISEALRQEMQRDPSVVIFGEDVMGGSGRDGERTPGVARSALTKGFHAEFPGRILDTPISESAFIGAAVGAAATGLRPVAELMFVDFMGVCFDQIFNQGAKLRYMFGGKAKVPMTIRTTYGAGIRAAAQHSECLYALFTHIPGLKVVIPSSPYEAKGLLVRAIRDDDPVIYFENKVMYGVEGDVPEELYTIPFGEANIVREGGDVTVVAIGRMVGMAEQAAERARRGRHRVRDHRPPNDLAARRGDDLRERRGDRAPRRRGRVEPSLQPGERHLRPRRAELLRRAQGARPEWSPRRTRRCRSARRSRISTCRGRPPSPTRCARRWAPRPGHDASRSSACRSSASS